MLFDKLSTAEKAVAAGVAIVALIGGIGGPFLMMGELRSDVRVLKEERTKLEARVKRLEDEARPRVAKGDLCAKLIDGIVNASTDSISGQSRAEPLGKMAEQMDCFEGVAAMTEEADAAAKP